MSNYSWIRSKAAAEEAGLYYLGRWTTKATALDEVGIDLFYLPTGADGGYELWVERDRIQRFEKLQRMGMEC